MDVRPRSLAQGISYPYKNDIIAAIERGATVSGGSHSSEASRLLGQYQRWLTSAREQGHSSLACDLESIVKRLALNPDRSIEVYYIGAEAADIATIYCLFEYSETGEYVGCFRTARPSKRNLLNVRFTEQAKAFVAETSARKRLRKPGVMIDRQVPTADVTRTNDGAVEWKVERLHPWRAQVEEFESFGECALGVYLLDGVLVRLPFDPRPGEFGVEVSVCDGGLHVEAVDEGP